MMSFVTHRLQMVLLLTKKLRNDININQEIFFVYRIFSVKCPQRLFQTLHGGPGICLNQRFIWARHCLRKGYLFFLAAVPYFALKS